MKLYFFANQPREYFENLQYQINGKKNQNEVTIFSKKYSKGQSCYHEIDQGLIIILENYDISFPITIVQSPNYAKNHLVIRFILSDGEYIIKDIDNKVVTQQSAQNMILVTSQNFGSEIRMRSNKVKILTIVFSKQWLSKMSLFEVQHWSFLAPWSLEQNDIYIHEEMSKDVKNHVSSLLSLCNIGKDKLKFYKEIFSFLSNDFHLLKTKSGNFQKKQDNLEAIINVKNFIMDNLKNTPTIDKLAEMANMSVSKFQNLFKEKYGMPVYGFIMNERLCLAKDLLETGQYTVGQISIKLGYSQPIKFIQVFKKKYGVTPAHFKRPRTSTIACINK